MVMLASDANNPQFLGAHNPDDVLQVEFYEDDKVLDDWETAKTGIKTYRPKATYIHIRVPGNPLFDTRRVVEANDIRRFPRQWQYFQITKGGEANSPDAAGWKLKDWPDITADQIRKLEFLSFYTVEQIADATDAQIGGIGMGGEGLRQRAKAALQARNSQVSSTEIAARDEKLAALEKQNKDLAEKLDALMARMESGTPDDDRPRRGRPPMNREQS
jgi:hypothetical protein